MFWAIVMRVCSICSRTFMFCAAAWYAFWNLIRFCVSSSMLIPSMLCRAWSMLFARLVCVVVPVVAVCVSRPICVTSDEYAWPSVCVCAVVIEKPGACACVIVTVIVPVLRSTALRTTSSCGGGGGWRLVGFGWASIVRT